MQLVSGAREGGCTLRILGRDVRYRRRGVHGEATTDTLAEVIEAVDGNTEVYIDGGFLRGSDVVNALALGATATAIGKIQAWALAAGGAKALVRTLEILEREIETSMGLIGVTSVDQLTPAYVKKALPVVLPHEMSAFTHLQDGRLL